MSEAWDRSVLLFRELVPIPQDTVPLTWNNAPNAFAYFVPVWIMSYLVRRRNTKAIRIALLPFILAMILRCTFRYANVTRPETLMLNWLRGLAGFTAIALTLDCALSDTNRLKVGEHSCSLPYIFSASQDQPTREGALPAWLADTFEVQFAFRGIGWNYGRGLYIPPETRRQGRASFLWSNLYMVVKGFLAVDAIQAFFRYVPGLGAPHGASIWNPNLPFLQRYATSTFIHMICGVAIQLGLESLYSIATLLGVGIFGQLPSAWPPIYGSPFKADSVHDFWARQWHQVLRRSFIVLGGIPGQWLAGRVGAVMGAFIASGLFHEFGFYLVNRGVDHRVTLFFALQGVAILIEKLFARYTGRRVRGWSGRVWTYLWIMAFGQICTDAWLSRGLSHSILIPLWMSPLEHIFIPIAKRSLLLEVC